MADKRASSQDDGWVDVEYWEDVPSTTPEGRRVSKDPGFARALGHGLLQGFFKGGSDEAAGAITRLAVEPGNGAAWRQPDGTTRFLSTEGDVYRAGRDAEREVLRGARENRGKTTMLGEVVGDIGSDLVAAGLGIPGVDSAPYNVLTGALSGLLGSDAELTPAKASAGSVASAAAETGVGAGLAAVLPKVGERVASLLPAAMARLRNGLEGKALEQGRRVLENVSTTLNNRKPTSDAAVRQALQDKSIAYLGTTGGAFERLEDLAAQRGAAYGGILEGLQRNGVQGPEAEALAEQLARRGAAERRVSGANTAIPDYFDASAAAVRQQPDPGFALASSGVAGPRQSRLALDQAEQTKRNLQREARLDRLNKTGLDEAKEEVARTYKEAIEETIAEAGRAAPPNSEVAELASEFEPVKRLLARTIEAREAAKRGAAAGQKRSAVGLSDRLAGNTAAAANLGTGGVLAATLGNMLARNRGTSTAARGLYDASRAANALARLGINNPRATRTLGNEVGALLGRQSTADVADSLGLGSSPGEEETALSRALRRAPPRADSKEKR